MNKSHLRTVLLTAGVLSPIAVLGVLSRAQQPPAAPHAKPPTSAQQFKNIKILKDLPADQLIPIMRKIDASLGVRCDFCHVVNADHTGFERDDKPMKDMARKMMVLTQSLNKQKLLGGQIGIAALLGTRMNCAAASSKRAVLVLRVSLRLQVSAAGVATIFSTSTPQGNEKDAQQGSYQSPQNEQAADAKLGIAGRWQNQQRGQYQGQQAKGRIACHWLHFSQRQRGRAQSHLGCISHTASGSQREGDTSRSAYPHPGRASILRMSMS